MTNRNGLRVCTWLWSVSLVAGAGTDMAHAADLAPRPGPDLVPAVEIAGPPYGYFNPILDPRCQSLKQTLYTARFRPTTVCQSRGLYEDSVLFP
jgi:hypothetical protein